MGRRTVRLTPDHVAEMPEECATCLFWELDPVRRRAARGHEREEKAAWLAEVQRSWGPCGRVALIDDVYAGHLVWAPPVFCAGAGGFATAPVSGDAVLLTVVHVAPEHRGGGIGRMLVQSMAKDLVRHGGVRAVEAFGDASAERDGTAPEGAGPDGLDGTRRTGTAGDGSVPEGCVLPTGFLGGVGFATHRDHPMHPRMRMDLRNALRLRHGLGSALERLLPKRAPSQAPATSGVPRVSRTRDPRSVR